MRNLDELDDFRDRGSQIVAMYGSAGDHGNGLFRIRSPVDGGLMTVIASDGYDWDHVSVSRTNRIPGWTEMEYVKRLFFKDDETAMQLHVPPSLHISYHPNCLHLWRPWRVDIPMPAFWMVAPQPAKKI